MPDYASLNGLISAVELGYFEDENIDDQENRKQNTFDDLFGFAGSGREAELIDDDGDDDDDDDDDSSNSGSSDSGSSDSGSSGDDTGGDTADSGDGEDIGWTDEVL